MTKTPPTENDPGGSPAVPPENSEKNPGDSPPVAEAAAWVPEFPSQRPPFLPGNEYRFLPGNEYQFAPGNAAALRHGAHSESRIAPIADAFVAALLADPGVEYLRDTSAYRFEINAWARAEARVALYSQYVDSMPLEQAMESSQGRTAAMELLRKAEAEAATRRTALGLTPMSRARLGRTVAAMRRDRVTELTAERTAAEREAQ